MSDLKRDVYFIHNGVTAVFIDGQQQPDLQRPWIEVFGDWLESQGLDPASFTLHVPGGHLARYFRTEEGHWNWKF